MRWQNRDGSDNIEDRRGYGAMRGIPIGGKTGIILLVVVLAAGFFGYDLTPMLTGLSGEPARISMQDTAQGDENDELARFSSVALKTTEETWEKIFRQAGREYSPATLVLYSGTTQTACGYGQSAMGPFYCPADKKVYLDLSFYNDMERKLGGGGDFALGYVLAHEIGHHVQDLLGISGQVHELQQSMSQKDANRLSVMLELQADCYAGVWGARMASEGILEPGDLQEALNTASAIGDDRLQKQSYGKVVPDSFTHGTSAERYSWFRKGFDSGDPGQCNTFKGVR